MWSCDWPNHERDWQLAASQRMPMQREESLYSFFKLHMGPHTHFHVEHPTILCLVWTVKHYREAGTLCHLPPVDGLLAGNSFVSGQLVSTPWVPSPNTASLSLSSPSHTLLTQQTRTAAPLKWLKRLGRRRCPCHLQTCPPRKLSSHERTGWWWREASSSPGVHRRSAASIHVMREMNTQCMNVFVEMIMAD